MLLRYRFSIGKALGFVAASTLTYQVGTRSFLAAEGPTEQQHKPDIRNLFPQLDKNNMPSEEQLAEMARKIQNNFVGVVHLSAIATQFKLKNLPQEFKIISKEDGLPTVDYAKAREYFVKRGENDRVAAYNLGLMYFNGLGVEKDLAKASHYFDLAKHELIEARYLLAIQYSCGIGVEKDSDLALAYLRDAKSFCDRPESIHPQHLGSFYSNLALLLRVLNDEDESKRYLDLAREVAEKEREERIARMEYEKTHPRPLGRRLNKEYDEIFVPVKTTTNVDLPMSVKDKEISLPNLDENLTDQSTPSPIQMCTIF